MLLMFNNYMRKVQTILLLLLLPFMVVMAENNLNNDVSGAPLYVVDGVVQTELTNIPKPEEIYSVTILKDETAIQLYGERGKNGVVVVTTKKSLGDAAVSMRSEQTSQTRSYKTYDPTKDKKPLYIVDGHIGVRPDDLPAKEEIAEKQKLFRRQAMNLYGQRATYGAVIIKTKEFVKTHGGGRNSLANIQTSTHEKTDPKILVVFLIVFLVFLIPWGTKKLIPIIRKYLEKEGIISTTYDPGEFYHYGEHFYARDHLLFWLAPVLCIILTGMFAWLAIIMFDDMPVISLAIFTPFCMLLIVTIVTHFMKHKCYLSIDKDGIRGTYFEPQSWPKIPTFIDVDLKWEDVAKAELVHTYIGRNQIDGIALFTHKDLNNPKEIINLQFFPTKKIVDCINYFYTRKTGTTEQVTLLEPILLEDNRVFEFFLYLIAAVIAILLIVFLLP